MDILGTIGTEPSAAAGITAFVGGRWQAFAVDLEGHAEAPASKDTGGLGVITAQTFAARLVPCFHFSTLFAACVVGEMGVLSASASSVPGTPLRSALFENAGARLLAEAPLTKWLSLRAYGDMMVRLSPVKLKLDGSDVWPAPPVAGLLGLGALAYFP
jgi:hypothetical protein